MDKDDVEKIFGEYGAVEEVILIRDEQGRSKGFGFVTFTEDADADAAMEALNGKEVEGRDVIVNEARPREDNRR